MGLFGRWRKKGASKEDTTESSSSSSAKPNASLQQQQQQQQQSMVADTSVFEFGSAASSDESITIAGFCPVSNDLEPCRWEVLPAPPPASENAPLFRIVF